MAEKEQRMSDAIPKRFPITEIILSLLGKGKMQLIFFLIFVLFFPFLAPVLKEFDSVYQFRVNSNLAYPWPKYEDLWLSFYTCVILILILITLKFTLKGWSERLIVERHTGKERQVRAEKFIESLFKTLYFTFAFVFGYWVAKDSYFLPPYLGGKGDVNMTWNDFPFQSIETFPYIREYILIQLGYHTQSFIVHIFSKPRNDFMEMLLHHSMTVCLVSLSYLMNYQNISHLILYTHDLSDLFVCLSRTLMDTKHKKFTFVSYIAIMISWFYMRLFIFPLDLIRVGAYEGPIHEIYGLPVMSAMVHVLLILHIYWYILLIKMGLRFMKTGVPVDTQKKLTE